MTTKQSELTLPVVRILFVEDNANTARAAKVMLELRGYQVDLAGSVADALKNLRTNTYELLISDVSLPDGLGHDILVQAPAAPPAIALSGYTGESDRAEALASGFSVFLTKPFKAEELISHIERVAAQ